MKSKTAAEKRLTWSQALLDAQGHDCWWPGLPPDQLLNPLLPPETTKLAVEPLLTVTTQKLPPPAPELEPLLIALTVSDGEMAHGRPAVKASPPFRHAR